MPQGYTDWIVHHDEAESTITARMEAYASSDGPLEAAGLEQFMVERGHKWQTLDIILSLLDNGNRYVLSLNVPNDGYITNLKRDAIVEVPALVGADRIYGLGMGDLPPAIAAILELQLHIMDLNVEAAVTGNWQTALEALIIDPCVPDTATAQRILDDMLLAQADLLPQFK
jgi:alpha-galactosidase